MRGRASFEASVEKALKAFLSWHDRPFRKTHSIEELGRLYDRLTGGNA